VGGARGGLELNRGMDHVLPPEEDADLPAFCRALGVPGLADIAPGGVSLISARLDKVEGAR